MINEKLIELLDGYVPMHAVIATSGGLRVAADSKTTIRQADLVSAYAPMFLSGELLEEAKEPCIIRNIYPESQYRQLTEKIGDDFLLTVLYLSDFDIELLKIKNAEIKPLIHACLYEPGVEIEKPVETKKPTVPGFYGY